MGTDIKGLPPKADPMEDIKKALSQLKGEKGTRVVNKAAITKLPRKLSGQVNQFVKARDKYLILKKEVESLRSIIIEYMLSNDVPVIETINRSLTLTQREMPKVTSRYTTYSMDLLKEVPDWMVDQCTTTVIDSEKVEGLVKSKKLPKSIADKYKVLLISDVLNVGLPK